MVVSTPETQPYSGCPGALAVELPEVADIVERHCGLSQPFVFAVHSPGPGEMEHGPEQHGGMAVGEHEPVAIGPDRILGIELHHAIPERVNQRRERHRRAGMPGFGLLTASIESVRMVLMLS